MSNIANFKKLLEDWDYELTEEDGDEKDAISGELCGQPLEPLRPVLRAGLELCNVGIVIGILDLVPERSRYGLLLSLLELDWDHALARISLVNTPVPKAERAKRGDAIRVIVAETTFFWSGANRTYFDTRMKALNAIALAASQHLGARSALSNTNPYYDRLKGTASPIVREDFTS